MVLHFSIVNFFSIILPTYNRAHFLPRAIESVIKQDYDNWELIIVDDGSTDNTKSLVQEFIQNDIRIRYIWQKNVERSAARNHGIKIAKGLYVCFLDSDDYFLPNHLSSFYKKITKFNNPIALLFGDTLLESYRNCKELFEFNHDNRLNWVELFLLNPVAPPRTCIHSYILKELQFNPKTKIGEDTELWVKIADKYPIYFVENKTHVTWLHENRTVNKLNTANYLENLFVKKHLITSLSSVTSTVKRNVLHDAYFTLAQSHEQNKQFLKMIDALLRASFYQPTKRWKEKVYMSRQLFFS